LKPKANRTPYWRNIGGGRFLGYRPAASGAGAWIGRVYRDGRYIESRLAEADDVTPADGRSVLDFRQAVDAGIAWCEKALKPKREGGPYTVADAVSEYLAWYRGHRKAIGDAELRARTYLLPALGALEVEALTAAHLRRWHQALAAAPARFRPGKERQMIREASDADSKRRRKASANRVLSFLRAVLNFAVAEGRVNPSVAGVLKAVRPFRRVEKPRIRYFDALETARLLNACEPDFRRLVTGALLTGARYGELISIQVADYAADSHLRISDSKSGEPRLIYLNAEGFAFFDRIAAGRAPEEPIFLRADGGRWARSHQIRRMAEAAKIAQLPAPNNFHVLRHTYASLYLMNGGSLEGLSEQLGHADTRMTKRSYAHLAEAWRAKEAQQHAPSFGLAKEEGGEVVRFKNGGTP
jgi:integrase